MLPFDEPRPTPVPYEDEVSRRLLLRIQRDVGSIEVVHQWLGDKPNDVIQIARIRPEHPVFTITLPFTALADLRNALDLFAERVHTRRSTLSKKATRVAPLPPTQRRGVR